jgi:UDP-N-acetylmuramoyl-L-alanine---L-glutamate ligase
MRLAELADQRVAVWGYGREGRAALSTLRRRLPRLPLTLICAESEAASLGAHADSRLSIITATVDAATLCAFDVVIKSPGISAYRPEIAQARNHRVRFTSGSALWFAEHPEARTICVTGTKGKSTVTALVAHLLRKSGKCVALAGNIGLPLLDLLDADTQVLPCVPAWWAIELSSFQTRDFDGAPSVAVINNIYEEHLDWHTTRERYVSDKLAIADRAHRLVVGAQPEVLERTAAHPCRTVFGTDSGWHVRDAAIWRGAQRQFDLSRSPLPGVHNAQNVCAALVAIEAAGEDALSMVDAVESFQPLPHRLQSLGLRDGLEYINDSISTTPYATMEALRSLGDRAVTVLVGGFDRGLDWSVFADYAAKHSLHAIVTMGANGASIASILDRISAAEFSVARADSLSAAMECARAMTPSGGAILLSPGAPSFDQFHDYAERGREFARLAGFDPQAIAQIQGLGIA